MEQMTSKQRVLGLLKGETVDRPACYSGTGTVWGAALKHYGYNFADAHHDPEKMARLATFPFEAAGFECALMPFDICVEAELLGCDINYFSNSDESIYPNIKKRLIMKPNEIEGVEVPDHVMGVGCLLFVMRSDRPKPNLGNIFPLERIFWDLSHWPLILWISMNC